MPTSDSLMLRMVAKSHCVQKNANKNIKLSLSIRFVSWYPAKSSYSTWKVLFQYLTTDTKYYILSTTNVLTNYQGPWHEIR